MWRASCSKRCLVRPVHVAVGTNPLVLWLGISRRRSGSGRLRGRRGTWGGPSSRANAASNRHRGWHVRQPQVWPGRQRVTTGTVRRLQSQWGPVSMGQLPSCSCFHQTLKKYLQAQDRPGVGSGIVSPDASAGGRFRSGEGLRPWTSMPSTRTVTKVSLVSSIVGCSLP